MTPPLLSRDLATNYRSGKNEASNTKYGPHFGSWLCDSHDYIINKIILSWDIISGPHFAYGL